MRAELWHGAGNNFLVICGRGFPSLRRRTIQRLACRFKTDGVVLVKVGRKIGVRYFDPAGDWDNCGNALRVVATLCARRGFVKRRGVILSKGLEFPFVVREGVARVLFRDVGVRRGVWVVGGVRQKVLVVRSFVDAVGRARRLRNALGCNVTLVRRVDGGVFARTFEVGVEGFTAACGTGAVAASLVTGSRDVFMPGGLLRVKRGGDGVVLSGPVERCGAVRV